LLSEQQGIIAMLYKTFIDDTADRTQQQYVIAAGLMGGWDVWKKFNRDWRKVLRAKPTIRWFHSKEWRSLTGEFFQFRDANSWPKPKGGEAANAKRERLKHVIEASRVGGIGVGVLVEDFNLVRSADPKAAEFFRPDPYEGALQALVYECARGARMLSVKNGRGPNGNLIGYVSDDSNRSPIYSAVYSDFKLKNPDIAQVMQDLAHLDDTNVPGLQAADLVAHVINQVVKELVKLPSEERSGTFLQTLPELQGSIWKIAHVDKWYMCSILEDLIGLRLFDKLGIQRREYKSDLELDNEKESGKRGISTILKQVYK
jgi:hypothetical protein